jgi:RNA polymerase sigma-70 factor (ECF subfamily)
MGWCLNHQGRSGRIEKAVADTTIGFQLDPGAAHLAAPHSIHEEHALIEGLRAGEEAAYEALIQRFEHPVFNVVSRLMDDRSDAADVVQEVFLKIFRNVGNFREDSSLKTWIYRISVNEARNHRRWFSRHRRQEVGLDSDPGEARNYEESLPDPGRSPFEAVADHETQELIEEALSQVNPIFRAALVLREIEGLSYEEISEILDISLGTVKSRILRGRDALRKHLAGRLEPASALAWSPQLAD